MQVVIALTLNPIKMAKSLRIIPKADHSPEQALRLEQRRSAPEHRNDIGPSNVWHTYNNGTLYGFFEEGTGRPIGIADASGPAHAVNAGWWIDKKVRGQGYGGALIDALAAYLKAKGYTGVGPIKIDTFNGEYQNASSRLEKRFRRHFDGI